MKSLVRRITQLVLTIGIVLLSSSSYAQPNFDWGVSYGGTSVEYGESVVVDNSGNMIVGGTIFSPTIDIDPGPAINNLTTNGSTDGYISKFDPSGNFQWVLQINGSNSDACYMVKIDSSGNIYASGYFSGTVDFDPGPGIFNMTANGTGDAFIIKLGTNGNLIWAKQLGAIGTTVARGIAIDNNGNVLTAGQFAVTCDFDPGPGVFNLTSSGSTEAFVLKLDPNGNFIWAKSLGGSSPDNAHDVDQAGSNGIIVIGEFQGVSDFDPGLGTFNLTSNGMRDGFAVMLDTNGNFVWASQYGAADNDRIFKSTSDQNGNVYLVGDFKNTVDFDPGTAIYNLSAGGSSDGFVLKLDATGNFRWAFKIGTGSVSDFIYDINYTSNSDLLVVGTFSNTTDFDPGSGLYNLVSGGGEDGYLAKYDTLGSFLYVQQFTGTSNQKAHSVSMNNSGVIGVSGHYDNTADIDPTAGTLSVTSNGILDAFAVRLVECINTSSSLSAFGCNSYTVPSGDETYTTLGSYLIMDTIPNMCGKDSVMSINLTITGSSSGTDVITACNSYTWIDNNTYSTNNNTATHTIIGGASNGCDSIVTLNLTINNPTNGSDILVECDSVMWIDGNTYYSNNTTATHTIVNGASNGCDSIVTLNLTMNNTATSTDIQTACNSYTWIDNNTYTSNNNTAIHTITNGSVNGCDSIVTLNLTINTVDNTTSTQGVDSISANANGASYRWLDCDNNYAVIGGATNQLFVAPNNGNYAVEVTQNGCTDTSACVSITSVGVGELSNQELITIYPNPTSGKITIELQELLPNITFQIKNVLGQIIADKTYTSTNKIEIDIEGEKGIYFLIIKNKETKRVHKILKQ